MGIRQKFREMTASHLELPKDMIFDLPRMILIGSYQIYIENYKSIIQFTDQFLHLRLNKGEMKIIGEKLVIRTILPEEIMIEGKFKEIQYID